jgi:putative oxidoreductase
MILLLFALAMTIALGVKAPLDFSAFSASAGAFLLAAYGKYPLSADALRSRASQYRFQH